MNTDVLRISQHWSKHDEKFQIYCKKHAFSCCSKCFVESHKECHDIFNLDEVIRDVKTSNTLYELEETLVDLSENIEINRIHQEVNMSTIQETSTDIKKEIKQTRIKINNHLDKLQEDLTKQLYLIKEKDKIENV